MNKHAQKLGRLARGVPKTISNEAIAARLSNMAKARAAKKKAVRKNGAKNRANNADDFSRADKFQPLEKDHAQTYNH